MVPNPGIHFSYADEGHSQRKAFQILSLSLDFQQKITKQVFKQELFLLTKANFEHTYYPVYHKCEMKSMPQKEPFTDIKYLFIHGAMTHPAPSLCLALSQDQEEARQI